MVDDGSGIGLWLKALLGYNGNPSFLEVIAYPLYLTVAIWRFVGLPLHAQAAAPS
ncbi:MAG: hypothetical protein GTO63_23675 [Anaerolineae bacterium]|nr:hypothetical protein [Anaerolineae bacterium]NIN97726.1 hypothetical protein [Anaerolineae bacterium]NIQ80707.1 hypothetical protein [Anaerolineae bacterium]